MDGIHIKGEQMKTLIELARDIKKSSNLFYTLYCNPGRCDNCPFINEEISCFASFLDDIVDDLTSSINSLNRIKGE